MSKIKIERNRKTPSDEQILQKKDFDSVLKGFQNAQVSKKWYQSTKLWLGVMATACIATVVGFMLSNNESESKDQNNQIAKEVEPKENLVLKKSNAQIFNFKNSEGALIQTENGNVISIPSGVANSKAEELTLSVDESEDQLIIKVLNGGDIVDINKSIALIQSNEALANIELLENIEGEWKPTNKNGTNIDLGEAFPAEREITPIEAEEKTVKFGKASGNTFELDVKNFPEFADYKGVKFQVDPSEKDFIEDYYFVDWQSFELKEKSQQYYLTLSRGGKDLTFKVNPVLSSQEYSKYLSNKKKKKNSAVKHEPINFKDLGFTIKYNEANGNYILIPESNSLESIEFNDSKKSLYKIDKNGTYKTAK